jgi:hypothetical protein
MRRTIAVVISILVSCSVSTLAAQGVATVMRPTVPSPTAASLGKFGDVPVSYFTGVPQISIPLFTAKGRTLELPISLSYHASGIKLDEIGSWVGAGWALEAGGAITRTVRGIVDEQTEGYFNTSHIFHLASNWTNPPPPSLIQAIHDDKSVDPEPDQFFFNFAGLSGEMVGGDTSSTDTATVYVTIPYSKWRIVPEIGPDIFTGYKSIRSWTITTENGTKYIFGEPEVHIDRSYQWLSGYSDSRSYASAWYLTEIRAPGGDVITLQYTSYRAEHHMGMYREQATDISEAISGDCNGVAGYPAPGESNSKIFDIHSQTHTYAQRLTSITTAAHTITFTHSDREDARAPQEGYYVPVPNAQQEPRLDLITVFTPASPSRVLRRLAFEYTYTGPLGGRLTLLNVYEEDSIGGRLPPYSFTYDASATLPPRVTDRFNYHGQASPPASFAVDLGGYYNGANTNSTPIPPGTAYNGVNRPGGNRNPDINFMRAGVLTKITYPTGGFNEFTYEGNDFNEGAPAWTEQVERSVNRASGSGEFALTRDFSIPGPNPTTTVDITSFIPDNCGNTPCPYTELQRADGYVISHWTSQGQIVAPGFVLEQGDYRIVASAEGKTFVNAPAVSITARWTETVTHPATNYKRPAPGLRISQLRTDDGMGNVTVRRYVYEQSNGNSSGWLTAVPRLDYNKAPPPGLNGCRYYSRTSQPSLPLGSGPLVGYSVVTESLGVNGVFGVVRRTFNAGCDCAAAAQAGNYGKNWPFLRYTTDGWRRGEQTTSGDYSGSGQIQRLVTSTYAAPPSPHPLIAFRGLAMDIYSLAGEMGGVVYTNQFYVRTGLKVLTAQATTLYDTTNASINFTTGQSFSYGNVNHAQLTEITETNSDGTSRVTRMRYPGDYASGGPGPEAAALTAMQNVSATGAHMPGVVIERTVSVKSGATDRVVQAEITTFKEFVSGSGQFLPFKHYVFNSPSPVP